MAVQRPTATVTLNGASVPFFAFSTQHSVEAPIAQATITMPSPINVNAFEDAKVVIQVTDDVGADARTVFTGRVRGPLERTLTDAEGTVTARCDGNLWRLALPATYDLSWAGPITPRKLLRQLFAFAGLDNYQVEEFVHPTSGVPLLLGGVPWFEGGRITIPAGTSPLAFTERICRLFGYRVFDRPDGRVRVARVSGPPPEADHELTEGVDILGVTRSTDTHPITTWWEAIGASGTDIAGQQVAVISRPRKGLKSQFVPNPPKWVGGQVSDPLLVTPILAEAARKVKEFDEGGLAWRVRAEAIGTTQQLLTLQPRQGFRVIAPSVELDKRFWQTAVSTEYGPGGWWVSFEGFRPTGKPARTAPPEDEPDAPDDDPRDPPAEEDLDPVQDPLPVTYDLPPDDPEYDPLEDPDGDYAEDIDNPPDTGFINFCPPVPVAPARQCETVTILESGWATDTTTEPLIVAFTPTGDADSVSIAGEAIGGPGTIELWQNAVLIGSAPLPEADPVTWEGFTLTIAGSLIGGDEAELHVVSGGA